MRALLCLEKSRAGRRNGHELCAAYDITSSHDLGPESQDVHNFSIQQNERNSMAVQDVPSSLLEARYGSDSETADMTVAAHRGKHALSAEEVEGASYRAEATCHNDEATSDSDASSSLEDAAYLDQLAGKRAG